MVVKVTNQFFPRLKKCGFVCNSPMLRKNYIKAKKFGHFIQYSIEVTGSNISTTNMRVSSKYLDIFYDLFWVYWKCFWIVMVK